MEMLFLKLFYMRFLLLQFGRNDAFEITIKKNGF